MASETRVAVQVETLLQQGEPKAALKLLKSVRKEALSGEDIASFHAVLAAARLVCAQAGGKHQDEAGRLADAAQQNIRWLGYKQALAAGEEWVDPFGADTSTQMAATHARRSSWWSWS